MKESSIKGELNFPLKWCLEPRLQVKKMLIAIQLHDILTSLRHWTNDMQNPKRRRLAEGDDRPSQLRGDRDISGPLISPKRRSMLVIDSYVT